MSLVRFRPGQIRPTGARGNDITGTLRAIAAGVKGAGRIVRAVGGGAASTSSPTKSGDQSVSSTTKTPEKRPAPSDTESEESSSKHQAVMPDPTLPMDEGSGADGTSAPGGVSGGE